MDEDWSHCEHGESHFSGGLWQLWDLWIKAQKSTRHVTSDTAGSQGSSGVMRSLSISRLLFSMLASFSDSPLHMWPHGHRQPHAYVPPAQQLQFKEPLSPLVPFMSLA